MEIITDPKSMQTWALRQKNIAFVPTMGALHEGHFSLIEIARKKGEKVVFSIFVNPTQFNDPGDYEKYPRVVEDDLEKLSTKNVDVVFCPQRDQMYSEFNQSWVEIDQLTKKWEGSLRPGHFRGVCTVVAKLFQIVQPRFAVFGEKDFQQLRIIEQMVEDLFFPIEILRAPLIREKDGLAMSSRNIRLSPEEREASLSISRGLRLAQDAVISSKGSLPPDEIEKILQSEIHKSGLGTIDYVAVVDEKNLKKIEKLGQDPARLLVAVSYPTLRLLDNAELRRT